MWFVPLLALLGGCLLSTGCSGAKATWKVDNVQMGTQFEFTWGTTVKIGFPGTVRGSAEGAGEITKEEPSAEPSE